MNHRKDDKVYLGADLGGTKLLLGIMTPDGKLLRTKKYCSGALDQRQAMQLIEASVQDFLQERPEDEPYPAAMGIGMVGRIDSEHGLWLEIDPKRCDELPVAVQMQKKFGIPCFIDNDVRSATKAEMVYGIGRRSRNFIYINVGTGIAAGIVTDGRLVVGGHCNAGEVGHTTSGLSLQVPCVCGRKNCVEPVASGLGLDISARQLAKEYPDTMLQIPADGTRVSVKEIFDLCGKDPLCTRLVDNAAQGVANLVMNLVRITDPDAIVLGGGLMSDDVLFSKVMAYVDPYTVRFVTNGITLTKLAPDYIGVLGACSNALLGLNEETEKEDLHEDHDCIG